MPISLIEICFCNSGELCRVTAGLPNRNRSWFSGKLALRLEDVWSALPEGRWETVEAVTRTSGLPQETVNRYISFLVRWNFAESQAAPDIRVRRNARAIPPLEVLKLLRSLVGIERGEATSEVTGVIAERIACRICGGRNLRKTSHDEVECSKCSERQWDSIAAGKLE